MNLNTKVIRMLVGALIGVQVQQRVRGAVPTALETQGDLVLLAGIVGYLAWSGRPSDGALGDVLDGIAVGIGATTASALVPLPF